MNDIRLKFEEIWPVPDGVYWHEEASEYWTNNHTYENSVDEWNARLDTFSRCQESMTPVSEIILHATNLLNYVRDKYSVVGDDFSCEHMRGIAAAIKDIQK